MNAAVQIFDEPMDLPDASPVPEQRQLLNELARARTRLAALTHELREAEGQLEILAPQRRQHELATEACASLEKLAEAGGLQLFWGRSKSAEQAAEHVEGVRKRLQSFNDRVSEIEAHRASIAQHMQVQSDLIDAIEHALFEAQDEEERLKWEWEIERELDEQPRKLVMPWARDGEDDRRFRKSAAIALLLAVIFTGVMTQITLPALITDDGVEVPERVVRLLMEERPAPPPPPREQPKPQVREQPEKKPVEQPVRVARVEEKVPEAVPEPVVEEQGILAFREKLASAKEDQVVGRLGSQARIDNADYSSGRAQRSMLTTSAPGSSGGINLAALSRGVGGGNGNGNGMSGVKVTRASSAIAAVGTPGGDRPVAGDKGIPGRTDEEIQIVFDRYKAALYRLYNKELRKDPTLRGQVVLKLTIEPDGSVSLCELTSTDMKAPELTAQVVERVKGFDFGAKAVPAITILYPIDFLPAA
jgi:outer membrane biosynthesis protein TonB